MGRALQRVAEVEHGFRADATARRTRRRWNPNIQRVRAMVGRTPQRLNVCASCLKAGKVARA